MRLGVVNDLHFTADPAARAAWHHEYDFAGVPARLGDAAAAFADIDAVVALGDLTHFGDEASTRAVLERLAALAARSWWWPATTTAASATTGSSAASAGPARC